MTTAAWRAVLGLPALFELLTIVGYYGMLALQLRVFRVPAPAGDGDALDTGPSAGEPVPNVRKLLSLSESEWTR